MLTNVGKQRKLEDCYVTIHGSIDSDDDDDGDYDDDEDEDYLVDGIEHEIETSGSLLSVNAPQCSKMVAIEDAHLVGNKITVRQCSHCHALYKEKWKKWLHQVKKQWSDLSGLLQGMHHALGRNMLMLHLTGKGLKRLTPNMKTAVIRALNKNLAPPVAPTFEDRSAEIEEREQTLLLKGWSYADQKAMEAKAAAAKAEKESEDEKIASPEVDSGNEEDLCTFKINHGIYNTFLNGLQSASQRKVDDRNKA